MALVGRCEKRAITLTKRTRGKESEVRYLTYIWYYELKMIYDWYKTKIIFMHKILCLIFL